MSLSIIGAVGIIILLIFFAMGVPVAFAMALVGFAGFCYVVSPVAGLELLAMDFFRECSPPILLRSFPCFVFMGSIAFEGGTQHETL